ncbi:hypothetical protein TEA_016137 [Camellia sinensis var. sinensis]|uniref:Sulfotransferase n=1 Tax=Camellia sinensis var. sinensis TaxID=542762 RepID=A0A4S4D1I0_CAMSN|nr:hypothetical protein TEA_016137 [Camellia sinensis var. sinensis]
MMPSLVKQMQCLEESAESPRERSLKFYKGCRKYTEGLGGGYDGDIAFASALENFGGGHNDPISVAFGVRRSNISTIVETLDKIYNLDWLTSASKNECTAAVGLKWMLNQGLMQHHEEIVEYFNTKGVSLIFLFRRNLLCRMISILSNSYDQNAKPLNGTHKSHVHSSHEAEILASYKPTIDTTLLIRNLRQVEEMTAKALEYFKSTQHIILYYEDIIKNSTKLKDVQDFLRVPQRDLKSQQVKIHKGSLSQHIENWDDIQRALYGTPYESFLHSDYNM